MPEITDPQLRAFLLKQEERDAVQKRHTSQLIEALVGVVTSLDRLAREIRSWREEEERG